ncbi:Proteasome subunit beta type-2-B [Porphyridium purpureum]|uniref:Proteasome subunit beta n=1 Tax=Porphyridium purpureum TaxID=35688 RepID=A0A5J4YZT1_PORPP|nr:Proteasome subunit beta type-2-B [Porphyridium purpureum]|eukprot:POR3118..scf208_2
MDSIIALTGDGFVMCAADMTNARSIVVMKEDMDKIMELDRHRLLCMAGEPGDVAQFTEYVQKNVHLYQLRTGVSQSTRAIANFTRNELAKSLRKNPYSVNLLLGGYDQHDGPEVFYLDYLGTLHKMPFSAQGYCAYFILATLDRYYKPNMSEQEALEVMRKAIDEVRIRFLIKQPDFLIKVVDKNGIRTVSK